MKIKIDTHGADNLMDFRGGKSGEACAKHLLDDFYVVTVISNPVRYSRRWQLYKEFAHRMAQQNIKLFTVECALGDRNFEITSADNPMNLQVRTKSELWHKENLINLGIRHLPKNTKYICWIDADIEFQTEDILKLYAHKKDVVVGAYPKKGVAWDKIRANLTDPANKSKELSDRDMASFGSDYAINFKFVDKETKTIGVENGLIKLHDAGTGFMMISREAILKMIKAVI